MSRHKLNALQRKFYTETAEGKVRHMSVITSCGEVLLPVKLVSTGVGASAQLKRNSSGLPYPVKRGERLVFALPGGGEVLR